MFASSKLKLESILGNQGNNLLVAMLFSLLPSHLQVPK